MRTLSIDIETYSDIDLTKSGVFKYVESDNFEILLFAWSYDFGPVSMVDLTKDELPAQVKADLNDPRILKTAYNANFEKACLAAFYAVDMGSWLCTMIKSVMCGIPFSLRKAAETLNVSLKLGSGMFLIRMFCIPQADGSRNTRKTHPEKWKEFCVYVMQDVISEIQVNRALAHLPDPDLALYTLDSQINARGIKVDPVLIAKACGINNHSREDLLKEAIKITGLPNPNSIKQLKKWLEEETETTIENLSADELPKILEKTELLKVHRVVQIRIELRKASLKKYQAMQAYMMKDFRVRGLFQYYGASRTGRWSGRGIQLQNLPRTDMKHLDAARKLARNGEFEMIEFLFGSVPITLSQLVRTAFVPEKGCTFVVSDFSAIEARVLSWLAGETWRMDVFATHGKIYEASASKMFSVPIEEVTKDSVYRQRAKVAELALGYQGSLGALTKMGGTRMGLTDPHMKEIVSAWREVNKRICLLWQQYNNAAIDAVKGFGVQRVGSVTFKLKNNSMQITLPSGRILFYLQPQIVRGAKFGQECVSYLDFSMPTGGRTETYGGKLTENIVQAVSRDLLAEAMLSIDRFPFNIVMHVHDEVVCEVPEGQKNAENIIHHLMEQTPEWAEGLIIKADTSTIPYYKK